jgi:uncharacterized protein YuzB (UPF0349 family)
MILYQKENDDSIQVIAYSIYIYYCSSAMLFFASLDGYVATGKVQTYIQNM